MYKCANCGSGLRYDITLHKMKCDSCDSEFEVRELQDESLNKPEYETNVYVCPQCGGEIYTQDNDMTGRCSYCGSVQIFQNRLETLQRPDWIIPFVKDKEIGIYRFRDAAKKAIFAPKEIQRAEHADDIRGVYMPYWFYHCNYDKDVRLTGINAKKHDYVGDDIIIYRDEINAGFQAEFLAMQEDASSWYGDEISDNIRPFDLHQSDRGMQPFHPAYLCGFSGETADVKEPGNAKKAEYEQEIAKKTRDYLFHSMDGTHHLEHGFEKLGDPQVSGFELGLLPVWFLAFRKGDRVSYSVVNGQSGQMAAEFPVDLKKFLLGTVILAAAIFGLLNLFWIMRPEYVAMAAAIGASWAIRFAGRDLTEIARKECELYFAKQGGTIYKPERRPLRAARWEIVVLLLVLALVFAENIGFIDRHPHGLMTWIPILLTIAALVQAAWEMKQSVIPIQKTLSGVGAKVFPGYLFAALAILAALVVQIIRPVSDVMYFGVGYLCMGMTLLCFLGLILSHNRMASRPMPQFTHGGGEDHA